jgi:DNA-binding transcriptional LysR family regulator
MAAFVKAAELGSFASAASALGMSPQMVAKHVTFLEARLGISLLNRTTRRQSLTPIGEAYLERCRIVLTEAAAADMLGQGAALVPRGKLRINAPVSFGSQTLTPMVTHYLHRFRDVEIDLVLSDRYVDKKRGEPSIPADLTAHECIGFGHWPKPAAYSWWFSRGKEQFEARIVARLRLNNGRALLNAALEGFGIVLVAEDVALADIASGRLVRVLPDFDPLPEPLHILYLQDRRQTPKLRSFIEAALQAFGPKTVTGPAPHSQPAVSTDPPGQCFPALRRRPSM